MDELQQLEAEIETGLQAFAQVGEKLRRIRDRRLYRQVAPTWDAYCKARWRFSRQRAEQLIDAAKIAREVGQFSATIVATESHARELKGMSPAARDRLLQTFTASERPTAAQLRQTRQQVEAMPTEKKLAAASTDERKAGEDLKALAAERARGQIERSCARMRELHADLPEPAAADEALDAYLEAIRAA